MQIKTMSRHEYLSFGTNKCASKKLRMDATDEEEEEEGAEKKLVLSSVEGAS